MDKFSRSRDFGIMLKSTALARAARNSETGDEESDAEVETPWMKVLREAKSTISSSPSTPFPDGG